MLFTRLALSYAMTDLRAPKHYGIGDLYLEACAHEANLSLIVNDANAPDTLSRVDFRQFLEDADLEFSVACLT